MLWLAVLLKLVTPPVVTIPVGRGPDQPVAPAGRMVADGSDTGSDGSPWSRVRLVALSYGKPVLLLVWSAGSIVVCAWSLARVRRFGRLLGAQSVAAPRELRTAAVEIGGRLGLRAIPVICTTSARISPMVWWTGGAVRLVIPMNLLNQMDAQQLQWVLAHELAHMRRGDHVVRWLEWLVCVGFWWNPVMWWARRRLRAAEEICCDALVVSCLNPKPRSYAESILMAIESVVCPTLRPPAMASEVSSGGLLHQRLGMIVSGAANRPSSPWRRACVLLSAVAVLPLGVANVHDTDAQAGGQTAEAVAGLRESDAEKLRSHVRAAIAAGGMTAEDGRAEQVAIRERIAAGDITVAEGRDQAEAIQQRIAYGELEPGITRRVVWEIQNGETSREDFRARSAEVASIGV